MNHRERVLAAIDHVQPDRVPIDYIGEEYFNRKIMKYLGASSLEDVLVELEIDLRHFDPHDYAPPPLVQEDGRYRDLFGVLRKPVHNQFGAYDESADLPFARMTSVREVDDYPFWPRVEAIDFEQLAGDCRNCEEYAVVFGRPGAMDLINGIAFGRGVEQVMLDIATEDEVYLALAERRFRYYYDVCEKALQVARKYIDILWVGDNYGTQQGLLMSPKKWNEIFRPKLKAFIDLGHQYEVNVMLHSCGSTYPILGQMVEDGLDIYQTVQPEAKQMNPDQLKRDFGDRLTFHGTMSIQKTLPHGTEADVIAEVESRVKNVGMGGGLILASAHHLQPDIPVENVLTMYRAAVNL